MNSTLAQVIVGAMLLIIGLGVWMSNPAARRVVLFLAATLIGLNIILLYRTGKDMTETAICLFDKRAAPCDPLLPKEFETTPLKQQPMTVRFQPAIRGERPAIVSYVDASGRNKEVIVNGFEDYTTNDEKTFVALKRYGEIRVVSVFGGDRELKFDGRYPVDIPHFEWSDQMELIFTLKTTNDYLEFADVYGIARSDAPIFRRSGSHVVTSDLTGPYRLRFGRLAEVKDFRLVSDY